MPGGDRTGPMGFGPMTGRAAGYCAGYPAPGFMNPMSGRGFGGWGLGRGWHYGYWPGGSGLASGFGRRFWGRGRGGGRGRGRGWGMWYTPFGYW